MVKGPLWLLFVLFFSFQLIAENPYDDFINESIMGLDVKLSGASLEKLKYTRYLVGEFIHKNPGAVNLEKIENQLVYLDNIIEFRTEVIKKCKLENINAIENVHPLRAKFIGASLFNASSKQYKEYLKPIEDICKPQSLVEMAKEIKKIIPHNKSQICKKDEGLTSILEAKKVLDINLDGHFKILQNYVLLCPIEKDVAIDKVCELMRPHIENNNFNWRKTSPEIFKQDTNHIYDGFNLVNFLNKAYQEKKISLEGYTKAIEKVTNINKEENPTVFQNDVIELKSMLAPQFNSNPSDLRMLNSITDNFISPRAGVPTMFQRYLMRLPDRFDEKDRVDMGNMLSVMPEEDKIKLFDIVKNDPKNWDSDLLKVNCDDLSEIKKK